MEEKKRSPPTLLENKQIAIIGGGPAGLVCAKILQDRGADVKIYEREASRHYRIQGGSLDLHVESGLAAIKAAGLRSEFCRVTIPNGDSIRMLDQFGKTHIHFPCLKLGALRPEIERGDLRDIFLNALKPDTVVWGAHFLSLKQLESGKVELSFAEGKKEVVDLVIGADGSNSKLRPYLTSIRPSYSGCHVIMAEVPPSEVSECKQVVEWADHGTFMMVGRNSFIGIHDHRKLTIYVSLKVEENWIQESGVDWKKGEQVKQYFQSLFSTWHPAVNKLFLHADPNSFVPRPIVACPIQQYWTPQSNITLLGDAAHVMPPFAGEGANMAMLDGLELANRLTNFENKKYHYSDIKSAVAGYEKSMFERMAIMALDTKKMETALHNEKGIEAVKKEMFGWFRWLLPILPYVVWGINWITDLLRITKSSSRRITSF